MTLYFNKKLRYKMAKYNQQEPENTEQYLYAITYLAVSIGIICTIYSIAIMLTK